MLIVDGSSNQIRRPTHTQGQGNAKVTAAIVEKALRNRPHDESRAPCPPGRRTQRLEADKLAVEGQDRDAGLNKAIAARIKWPDKQPRIASSPNSRRNCQADGLGFHPTWAYRVAQSRDFKIADMLDPGVSPHGERGNPAHISGRPSNE